MADTQRDIERSQVRRRDADGHLIEAGYWWFEPRLRLAYWTDAVTLFAWVAAGALLVLVLFVQRPAFFAGLVACGAILAVRYAFARHWLQQYREVLFCADGRIFFAPDGISGSKRPDLVESIERHDGIISIEAERHPEIPVGDAYGVKMHFRSGTYNTVTMHHYYEHHARVIAVQLTRALQELREAGRTATKTEAARKTAPLSPARPRRVIE